MQSLEGLLSYIYDHEAKGNYDQWNYGTRIKGKKPLTEMTVREVMDVQRQNLKLPKGQQFTAAGALQIIHGTLAEEVDKGTVSMDDLFDKDTQDRLAVSRLRFRGLDKWQSGKLSTEEFGNNVAKEWASMPVLRDTYRGNKPIRRGQGYYGGVSTNPSNVAARTGEFEAVLGDPGVVLASNDQYQPTGKAKQYDGTPSQPDPLDPAGSQLETGAYSRQQWSPRGIDKALEGIQMSSKEPWKKAEMPSSDVAQQAQDIQPLEVNETGYKVQNQGGGGPVVNNNWLTAFKDEWVDSYIVRGASANYLAGQYEIDPVFDLGEALVKDGLTPQTDYFIANRTKSNAHYERLKKNLEYENFRNRRRQESGSFTATALGAMTNPDSLLSLAIPGAVAFRVDGKMTSNALRSGTSIGGMTAGFETAMEMGRAPLDPNSSFTDSAMRVGASTVFAGLLGGAFGAYAGRFTPKMREGLEAELRGSIGADAATKEIEVDGVKMTVQQARALSEGEVPTGVRIRDGKIEVDADRILQRFESGDVPEGINTPNELLEYEIGFVAGMKKAMGKFWKEEEGSLRIGRETGEVTPVVKADDTGVPRIDEPALAKALEERDVLEVGPIEGSPKHGKFQPVKVYAEAFEDLETLKKFVADAQEIASKARDPQEWSEAIDALIKRSIKGEFEEALPAEEGVRRAAARQAERQASVEAEAAARKALEKYREKNNKILMKKKSEMLSRLTDGPFKRIHRNAMTGEVRDLVDKLASDGAFLRGSDGTGLNVGSSVYSRAQTWDGVVWRLRDSEKKLYNKYMGFDTDPTFADISVSAFRRKRADGSKPVSIEDFRKKVSQAYITGQRDTTIPEVNEMVEHLRGAWDEYKIVGERYGVLSSLEINRTRLFNLGDRLDQLMEGDPEWPWVKQEIHTLRQQIKAMDKAPDEDYFTRVWSLSAIRENREAFKENIVKPWMRQQPYVDKWVYGKVEIQRKIDELRQARAGETEIKKWQDRLNGAPELSEWRKVATKRDAASMDKRADEMIEQIMQEADPNDLATLRTPNRPTFGRSRQFNIPNKMLLKDGPMGNGMADFIETDYLLVHKIYSDRMGPAIEMGRSFARPIDGVSWKQGLDEAIAQARASELRAFEAKHGEQKIAPKVKRMTFKEAMDEAVEAGKKMRAHVGPLSNKLPKEMEAEIRARLDEMGLEDIKVEGETRLGKGGGFSKMAKTIYLATKNGEVMEVLHHEMIHAMRAKGFFSDAEWGDLTAAAAKLKPVLQIQRRYPHLSPEKQAEESVADMFRFYMKMGGDERAMRELMKEAGPLNPTVFDRLKEFFRTFADMADAKRAAEIFGEKRGVEARGSTDFDEHWEPIKRDMLHLVDRVTNRVSRNPERIDNRSATVLRNWSHLAFMGMAALPQLAEIGTLVMRHGFGKTMQSGFMKLDDDLKAVFKENASEMRKAGGIMDVMMGASLSRMAETGIDAVHGTAPERWLKTASNRYFLWNGLAAGATRLKEMDAHIRVSETVEKIHNVAEGTATKADLEYLDRWGISSDLAKRMAKEPIEQAETGHWMANTDAWGDEELVRHFRSAIRQGNENTVLFATAADKPTIVDGVVYIRKGGAVDKYAIRYGAETSGDYWRLQSGLGTLPFTFWNYAIAAHNKVLVSAVDEPTANVLGGLSTMIAIGYMVGYLKTPSDRRDRMDLMEKVGMGVDQSGVMGIIPQAHSLLQGSAIAATGRNPSVFGPPNGYMPSKIDAAVGVMGAGPSAARNLVQGAAELDANRFSWGLPYRNFIGTKWAIDAMVDGTERRKQSLE